MLWQCSDQDCQMWWQCAMTDSCVWIFVDADTTIRRDSDWSWSWRESEHIIQRVECEWRRGRSQLYHHQDQRGDSSEPYENVSLLGTFLKSHIHIYGFGKLKFSIMNTLSSWNVFHYFEVTWVPRNQVNVQCSENPFSKYGYVSSIRKTLRSTLCWD